jgi:hypothetical protein
MVSQNSIARIAEKEEKKKRVTSAGGMKKNDQSLIHRILSNLCHSLAINEEMAFEADLKRFTTIIEDFKGSNKN